jgi:hypothetical protein
MSISVTDAIAAFSLPAESRVDQRVPKKLVVENGAPTAADKRRINDGIEELLWVAALKPTAIGVAEYRDDAREYLEIALLLLTLRPSAKGGRIAELVHRAIPYPVILLAQENGTVALSLAHKRWSQGEAGKMVLDDALIDCELVRNEAAGKFLSSLSISRQPRMHLLALYQGWINCLQAYKAACITGQFVLPTDGREGATLSEALAEHDRLTRRIAVLRAQAEKESQINRMVEINLEVRGLEIALAETIKRMG